MYKDKPVVVERPWFSSPKPYIAFEADGSVMDEAMKAYNSYHGFREPRSPGFVTKISPNQWRAQPTCLIGKSRAVDYPIIISVL